MEVDYQKLVSDIARAADSGRIRIPSFPENLIKLKEALNNPEISVRYLAQLVHTDPVLANRIFAIAQSAAYQLNTEQDNLLKVMQRLGMNVIRGAIYNHCLAQLFNDRQYKRVEVVASFVRNRSLEVAGIAYAITKRYDLDDPSLALLSGLFHNVGALVILNWLSQNTSRQLTEKEQKALVVYGQYKFADRVLEKWQIPETLRRVISAGEDSVDTFDERNRFVHLVNVARWVSRILRSQKTIEDPPLSSLALFNLDVDEVLQDKDVLLKEMIRVIQLMR
ncbi:MAG: HDOD domain-containing protein [Gammaproteobacteria bacterium]|nr:HDOD domain-containing protein [Gammaproteobacteria bacterium]NVK89525.1 HDOD domain-containing protein [Gammaproteobacteria bacterium]